MVLKLQTLLPMGAWKFPCRFLLVLGVLLSTAISSLAADERVHRIVSLSPSITEIIYALGEGGSLIGVTPYCDYPIAAKALPKVGGLFDANIEAILALKPTLVIAPREHQALRQGLSFSSAEVLTVKQETISEIKRSILEIGSKLGRSYEADTLVRNIETRIAKVKRKAVPRKLPRVLVVIGGHRNLDSFYAAGKETFYNELIELAGGINAYSGRLEFPILSAEGVVSLNPDIILDLVADVNPDAPVDVESLKVAWQSLPNLKAVAEKQVYLFTDEFMINPGPRIPLILEKFAWAIQTKGE